MSGWDDEEWKPPSAEQLAEIEKRRARKDYTQLQYHLVPQKIHKNQVWTCTHDNQEQIK